MNKIVIYKKKTRFVPVLEQLSGVYVNIGKQKKNRSDEL